MKVRARPKCSLTESPSLLAIATLISIFLSNPDAKPKKYYLPAVFMRLLALTTASA
jgi:hypothetical protein